jgi:hypothetical protein
LIISLATTIWGGVNQSVSNMKFVYWLTEMPVVYAVAVVLVAVEDVNK